MYFLYNTGVVEGYQSNDGLREYRPSNNINRAEFLKLLFEGTGVATGQNYEKCFPDVPPDAWYSTYVCQAKSEGIVNGYPDGTFKPDQIINQVESLKILGELEGWSLREKEENEQWYQPYFELASKRGIMAENDAGAIMDRGDIAEMIYRNKQIDVLNIESFDADMTDELFEYYEIPHDGALAPGGLFGPGGPFGNTGAFYETSDFNPIDETYFDQNFCYFSDEGDFWERVEEVLSGIDITGYDADGFGLMFCHKEEQKNNMVYFDDLMREQFDVACWYLPEGISDTSDYEEILCYVDHVKITVGSETPISTDEPYCIGRDNGCTVCYENILSNNIISQECPNDTVFSGNGGNIDHIEISGLENFTAGGSTYVDVDFVNEYGDPVSPTILPQVKISTGRDFVKYVNLTANADGGFSTVFDSDKSGYFTLSVTDETTNVKNAAMVYVEPARFADVKVKNVNYDYENDRPDRAIIEVAGVDKYGNVLPYSSVNNNLSAVATMGSVEISHNENGIFTIELTASDWGVSDVTITTSSGISLGETVQVAFLPIQLNFPKAVEEESGQFSVPMYIYFPKNKGKLGEFSFNLMPSNKLLQFVDIEDPIPGDAFGTPLIKGVNSANGMISIQGIIKNTASTVPETIRAGDLLFNAASIGDGVIYVQDAVIKNTDGENKSDEEMWDIFEEFWKWWYKVKPWKSVCVDVFIFEGSDATDVTVSTDVVTAMQIFSKNAQQCDCNFFLDIAIHAIEHLTAQDFNDVDTNGDGDVDLNSELDEMVNRHPPSGNCIPVYYVPKLDDDTMGASWNDPTDGVTVDESTDHDNRTLAHELAHQLSKGVNKDQPHAHAHDQGADQPGNLMHYDDTGDDLTPIQCEEIEKNLI
ncbi:S-layer homology domain-containing protein [Candidatus Peregrinibacteria bacterium]|nr:S-layer homology domain-containing protein [Candidatus Peregrinibacteria bacterium]